MVLFDWVKNSGKGKRKERRKSENPRYLGPERRRDLQRKKSVDLIIAFLERQVQ
jgi:hypothetical protein